MTDFIAPVLSERAAKLFLALNCATTAGSLIANLLGHPDAAAEMGAGSTILLIFTAGFFLYWLYRSHKNLDAVGVTGLAHSHGATVVWWFVPIANLIKPFAVMDELVRASGRAGDAWKKDPTPPVVHAWWLTWIGSNVLALLGTQLGGEAPTPLATALVALSDLVQIAAAVPLWLIMDRVASDQLALREEYDPVA